jgi:pimeloyl-ACP methyl ester carboxylesterase
MTDSVRATRRSRALTALLVVVMATVAVAAGLVALGAVAVLTARPWVFVSVGVLVFLVVDLAGATWVARRRAPRSRARLARWTLLGVSTTLLLAVFAVTALIPPGDSAPPREAVPGARPVALATGSRLTVLRLPARGPVRRPPIVVLHGGPGIPDLDENAGVFAPLTDLGADIYLYAQLGTDGSGRLADPRGYGRDRDVADLEALRRGLGLDRITLLGHSYGGALAAAYLAAHPDHVSRIVLVSPGALDPSDTSGNRATAGLDTGQRMRLYAALLAPRSVLGYGLLQLDPEAAHAFVGDAEADARDDAVVTLSAAAVRCPGAPAGPPTRGSGFYAMQYPQSATAAPPADVRARLTGLPTPALIVKGSCDYLSWRSALGYRDRLPHSRLIYLSGVGHNLHQEDPAAFLATVRAFLTDQPSPQPPVTGDRPPPDHRGPP